MSRRRLVVLAALSTAALAAGCGFLPIDSDLMLLESGYSIKVAPYGDQFAIRVHANQLKQLGGDVKGAEFQLFVSERLKMHEICLGGWEEQPCADEASCVQRTRHSVTVFGRCLPQ